MHSPHAAQDQSPYVCVYASQVAACIGSNRHRKVSDAMMTMWQRISPTGFRDALARNNMKTDEDHVHDLVQNHPDVRALVDKSLGNTLETSSEVAAWYSGAIQDVQGLCGDMAEADRLLVEAAVRKNVFTAYGTRAEPEMLTHIRDVLDIPCHADPAFYKERMGDVDGVPWFVGGRVDAVSDDGKLLIEIKNRVNRLFYRAPAYESVQVQTYLHLLNLEHGVLVECLKSDDGDIATNVMAVCRDDAFWDRDVRPKLQKFVSFLVRLLRDPMVQDSFLKSKRPSAMIAAERS